MPSAEAYNPFEITGAVDPYRTLGLDRRASEAEIKRAYFQLVRQFPPEQAPEKFQEIRSAYELLRSPESKARIDLFLIQPPPELPNRRRATYDLSVHAEDLFTLALEAVATPIQEDFPLMLEEAPYAAALRQMQNRLLNMAQQLDQIQGQMAPLVEETRAGAEQVDILTRHLTSTQPLDSVHEQLATLSTQLATLSELVAQLAPRAQIEQLLQTVANQAQVAQLDETFKRLSRTQFKANSLSESKEQQVQNALATLQDLATRRAQIEEAQTQRTTQQLDAVRRAARGELAAELLPALDSLELALEHGAALLKRQRTQTDELSAQHQRYLIQMQSHLEAQDRQIQRLQQPQSAASPGLWRRLFGSGDEATVVETPPPPPPLPQPVPADALQETQQQAQIALQSWLHGLELVRDRFVALLATEDVQMIDALHKPFDPRLHVAMDTLTRSDIEPNRVVAVLRKGYRQRERILRYAEVVVARQPVADTEMGTVTDTTTSPSLAT